jgi:hypothetical protein
MTDGVCSKKTKELQPYKQSVTWRICVANFCFTATYGMCVSAERNLTNRVGEILGFGETTEGNTKLPCTLQRAYIQIFTIKECNESGLPSHTLKPWLLCAGVIDGGVDSCQVSKTTQVITWCSYSCRKKFYIFMKPEGTSPCLPNPPLGTILKRLNWVEILFF